MECSGVTEPNSALHRAEILRSPKVLESIAAPTYLRPSWCSRGTPMQWLRP